MSVVFKDENQEFKENTRDTHENEDDYEEEEINENSGDEWFIEQDLKENEAKGTPLTTIKYGFALTKSNVFSKLSVSI